MIAKEIMRKKVVTASPHMTLHELSALLIDHQITGAPVVNSAGLLVGVISQTDLVRHERETPKERPVPGYYMEDALAPSIRPPISDTTRVRDCMTPIVISADRKDDVREVAKTMLEQKIHRIIIAENGKLFGIVTTVDLLKALLGMVPAQNGAKKRRAS